MIPRRGPCPCSRVSVGDNPKGTSSKGQKAGRTSDSNSKRTEAEEETRVLAEQFPKFSRLVSFSLPSTPFCRLMSQRQVKSSQVTSSPYMIQQQQTCATARHCDGLPVKYIRSCGNIGIGVGIDGSMRCNGREGATTVPTSDRYPAVL